MDVDSITIYKKLNPCLLRCLYCYSSCSVCVLFVAVEEHLFGCPHLISCSSFSPRCLMFSLIAVEADHGVTLAFRLV